MTLSSCIADCVEHSRTTACCRLTGSVGVLSSTTLGVILEQTNHIGAKEQKKEARKVGTTSSTYSHCSVVPAELHKL